MHNNNLIQCMYRCSSINKKTPALVKKNSLFKKDKKRSYRTPKSVR